MLGLWILIIATVQMSQSIDFMPCTEAVDGPGMALARRILEQSTPPGYRMVEFQPHTQTGRHPHRWICRFERIDNVYRTDCPYLTEVRTAFRRYCPFGCDISQISVAGIPNQRFVSVEILVYCGCERIPHRRRRHTYLQCNTPGRKFEREKTFCTGIPNFQSK